MKRLNELTRITQTIQSNKSMNSCWLLFGKPSLLLTFLEYLRFRRPFMESLPFRWPFLTFYESIELIQSFQSLEVNRLSHLLYENESTRITNELALRRNWINSIVFVENESIQINHFNWVDWYTSPLGIRVKLSLFELDFRFGLHWTLVGQACRS